MQRPAIRGQAFTKIVFRNDKFTEVFNDSSDLLTREHVFKQPTDIYRLHIKVVDKNNIERAGIFCLARRGGNPVRYQYILTKDGVIQFCKDTLPEQWVDGNYFFEEFYLDMHKSYIKSCSKILNYKNKKGLLLKPKTWCKIKFKTNNCILMVFCDREYEFEDYIEDYKNFLNLV